MKGIWDLFIAFMRASNLSFGGGPAAIPLIRMEAVTKYGWLTEAEFASFLAVSNSLPAPIITKLAGMIGYKVKGLPGALVAILGAVLPTTLVVVFLGGLIMKYAQSPALAAMLKGVRPVVAVLLLQAAIEMGKDSFSGKATWLLGIAALGVMLLFPFIHPAILVVLSMALGCLIFRKKYN